MSPRYSRCLSFRSPVRGLDSSSREADDVGERRAQLVGHVADELVLQPVGGDQRLVALEQRALVALGRRDVGEGDERRAIGQRRGGEVDHALVRPDHLAVERLALDRRCAVTRAAMRDPGRDVVVERARWRDDLVDVRALLQRARATAARSQRRPS